MTSETETRDEASSDDSVAATTRRSAANDATAPAVPSRVSARAPALSAGSHLGAYVVRRTLGVGGMGTVYLAHDEALDREVAIKTIRSDLAAEPQFIERFRAEARTMARLNHPHVVRVLSLDESEDGPRLVMEHVPGPPLSRLLRERGGPVRPEEAVAILDQVCRGVSAIHAAGLVHRDLKPANILVGPAFRMVVSDLGLSHRIGFGVPDWSTPGYAAPELVSGAILDDELAARVDVYAIGVIAYELLTGGLPFGSSEGWSAALASLQRPPPPSEIRPELSPAFDRVVLDALAWSPEVRTASVDAFRRDLGRAALGEPRAPKRALRFLVVDDDPTYAALSSQYLAKAFPGAVVEAAEDGRAALDVVSRTRVDLVVTDLDMPGMNGIELTATLRGDEATRTVPVIVVSAVGGATDWSLLGRMGANAFVGKPFDAAQLSLLARMLVV